MTPILVLHPIQRYSISPSEVARGAKLEGQSNVASHSPYSRERWLKLAEEAPAVSSLRSGSVPFASAFVSRRPLFWSRSASAARRPAVPPAGGDGGPWRAAPAPLVPGRLLRSVPTLVPDHVIGHSATADNRSFGCTFDPIRLGRVADRGNQIPLSAVAVRFTSDAVGGDKSGDTPGAKRIDGKVSVWLSPEGGRTPPQTPPGRTAFSGLGVSSSGAAPRPASPVFLPENRPLCLAQVALMLQNARRHGSRLPGDRLRVRLTGGPPLNLPRLVVARPSFRCRRQVVRRALGCLFDGLWLPSRCFP